MTHTIKSVKKKVLCNNMAMPTSPLRAKRRSHKRGFDDRTSMGVVIIVAVWEIPLPKFRKLNHDSLPWLCCTYWRL